jgi:hypothetical protein
VYLWLWRALPGPWWVRGSLVALLVAGVVVVLFVVVFPWVDARLLGDPAVRH